VKAVIGFLMELLGFKYKAMLTLVRTETYRKKYCLNTIYNVVAGVSLETVVKLVSQCWAQAQANHLDLS